MVLKIEQLVKVLLGEVDWFSEAVVSLGGAVKVCSALSVKAMMAMAMSLAVLSKYHEGRGS